MPLGHISETQTYIPYVGYNRKRYREIKWWGNRDRINYYIKKIVHGPEQEDLVKQCYDRVGKYIIPDNREKILIKKVYDPDRNIVKIYDMDERVLIGRVRDNYMMWDDMNNMLELIRNTDSTEKRNTVFIENLYKIDGICKYQKVDQNF